MTVCYGQHRNQFESNALVWRCMASEVRSQVLINVEIQLSLLCRDKYCVAASWSLTYFGRCLHCVHIGCVNIDAIAMQATTFTLTMYGPTLYSPLDSHKIHLLDVIFGCQHHQIIQTYSWSRLISPPQGFSRPQRESIGRQCCPKATTASHTQMCNSPIDEICRSHMLQLKSKHKCVLPILTILNAHKQSRKWHQ